MRYVLSTALLLMGFAFIGIGAGCEKDSPMEDAIEDRNEALEERGDALEEQADRIEDATDELD